MSSEEKEIYNLINDIEWYSPYFSISKAYVCSFFSKIVYEHIPEFELEQSSRIHLIPCEKYIKMLKNKTTSDSRTILRGMDLEDIFVIETRLVIIVGVRTKNATFVAIRGTVALNDWLINLNVRPVKISRSKYHRGFYKAILECWEKLINELEKSKSPIYLTGHSLGGAMAAILHSQFGYKYGMFHDYWHHNHFLGYKPIWTFSCYTFGMPRYGNKAVVSDLATPFHFYNHIDIVPTVPPKWLGYKNCENEFKMEEKDITITTNRSSINLLKWLYRIIFRGAIKTHSIELYNSRLHIEMKNHTYLY